MNEGRNRWLTGFAVLTYVFLFAPIVILIIFSFNVSRRNFVWLGFTTDWYPKLFANQDLIDSVGITLQVAVIAVIGATILGSLLGLGLARLHFRGSGATETLLLLPMVTPEIIMGISLLIFFSQLFAQNGSLGPDRDRPRDVLHLVCRGDRARAGGQPRPEARGGGPRPGRLGARRLLARDAAVDRACRGRRRDAGLRALVRRPGRSHHSTRASTRRRCRSSSTARSSSGSAPRSTRSRRSSSRSSRSCCSSPGGSGRSAARTPGSWSNRRPDPTPRRLGHGGAGPTTAGTIAEMDATTTPILEIGLILLAAMAGGFVARRLGLPAIVGYLVVGLGFSPFTPGYVADHVQLELLADVGVVLLLFEVGMEVDLTKLRRDHGRILLTAPAQVVLSTGIAGGAFYLAGLEPVAAALIGLCVALSSSVVIVNITVSRRRTTDPPTEEALLGWSVIQDLVGVGLAAILLAAIDPGRPVAPGGGPWSGRVRPRDAGRRATPAVGASAVARRARPVPDRVGRVRPGAGRSGRRGLRGPAGPRRVRRRAGRDREPRGGRGAAPAAAVPRRLRGPVLRGHRDAGRSEPAGGRGAVDRAAAGARPGRQGRRGLGVGPDRAARGSAAPARRRSRSDRGVLVRAGHRGPRRGHDRHGPVHGDHRVGRGHDRGQLDRGAGRRRAPGGPGLPALVPATPELEP